MLCWKNYPKSFFQPSYFKAGKALTMSLSILVLGYILLVFLPWFALPIGWVIVGTATTSLMAVAYDCRKQKFVRSKVLNELVGCLCLVPLFTPFITWCEERNQNPKISNSPFWFTSSLWQQLKTNVELIAQSILKFKSKHLINLFLLYLFVCLFFPIMTMTVGIWGLFKYYFIPLAVYHFWISSQLKMNVFALNGNFSFISYPKWVEFLGNNFNNSLLNLPSYNLKEAKKVIKDKGRSNDEVSFSIWTLFFTSSATKKQASVRSSSAQKPHFAMKTDRKVFKIHGEYYDVTNFTHPGGPVSVSLGYSRDATALFETHHPFTSRAKLDAILSKYRVPLNELEKEQFALDYLIDQKEVENDVFNWNTHSLSYPKPDPAKDDFTSELRREVKAHFETEAKRRGISLLAATKATKARYFEMILFTSLFLISLPFFIQGYYITIVLVPCLAWLYGANTLHDGTHFAIHTNWIVNLICGHLGPWSISPLIWYHQHVIGHHAYPNVEYRDPDIAHAPAFLRVHPSIKWKPAHRYQKATNAAIWTFGAMLYLTIVPIKALIMGCLNRSVVISPHVSVQRKIIHVLGRIMCVFCLWGWQWYAFQGDGLRIFCFMLFPMIFHSFLYMLSTQINHLTQENMPVQGSKNLDYYEHQVRVSHSFCTGNKWVFLLTGGLNVQIEHHLFPTVNHCHLLDIQPIVIRLCKKYNIPYHASGSLIEAVGKYYDHIEHLSFNHLD